MMKLLVIFSLSLTGLVFSLTEQEDQNAELHLRNAAEDILNDTLNKLIDSIPDPYTMETSSQKFENNTLLTGGLNITKLRVDGIHSIMSDYISVDIFTQKFNLTLCIPSLDIRFKYWLDILIGELLPLYGSGLNSIFIEGVYLNVSGKVDIFGQKFKNITANLTVDHMVFNLDGILDNPEFTSMLNLILNDNVCEFIKKYHEFISSVVTAIIAGILGSIQ